MSDVNSQDCCVQRDTYVKVGENGEAVVLERVSWRSGGVVP